MIKRKSKALLCAIASIGFINSIEIIHANAYNNSFSDTKGHWAEAEISKFNDLGYISGYEDKTFKPNNSVTRAEFVKILTGLFYPDYKADDVNFGDVTPDDWYSPYVAKACKLGLVQGYENGYFGANDFITRQDMATILYRLTKNENYDYKDFENEDGFSDDDRIEQYAKEIGRAHV